MIRKTIFLGIFFALMACTPLVTNTPPPAPKPILVAYPPGLSNWNADLHTCALQIPEIALTVLETSLSDPEFMEADVSLSFGEPPHGISGYAASLGEDEIIIVAGEDVRFEQLSLERLSELYSNPGMYQVWTYGSGNEFRAIFDPVILNTAQLSPETRLAPHPAAMLEAVAENPLAIGYLPKSWLTGDVRSIPLEADLQAAFQQPILALTKPEPQGALRKFLTCLQQDQP